MEISKKEKNSTLQAVKFFAMDNNREIGHAYLYLIYNQCGGYYYGLLEDVFVKEEYREKGVGTDLVKEIILEVKERKLHHLIATSRYSRTHIHKWYEKLGFSDYGKEFRIDF